MVKQPVFWVSLGMVAAVCTGVYIYSLASAQERQPVHRADNQKPYTSRRATFEAEIISGSHQMIKSRLVYDQGKFRQEQQFARPGKRPFTFIELYDGSHPQLVWNYNVLNRSAGPTLDSRLSTGTSYIPQPTAGPIFPQFLERGDWRLIGKENIAGFPCDLYELRYTPKEVWVRVTGGGRGAMGDVPWSKKAWVEPSSGIVMRHTFDRETPPDCPLKPIHMEYRMTRLQFLPSVSPACFRLPAGTTAFVYDAFDGVNLPKGVTGVRKSGNGVIDERWKNRTQPSPSRSQQ